MYILDETKYCWTTNDTCGQPMDTIEEAINDFYEYDCENLDCTSVDIGHPSYYIPNVFNAEQLMWDIDDKIEEDYDIIFYDKLTDTQDEELEKRLQDTLYQFLKENHLDKRVWTVFQAKEYNPLDYGINPQEDY